MADDESKKSGSRAPLILAVIVGGLLLLILTLAVSFGAFIRFGPDWNKPTGTFNGALAGNVIVGPDCRVVKMKRSTVYSRSEEGGINDVRSKQIHYLEDYLAGKVSDYAGLSSDLHAENTHKYTYGTKAYIPAIEKSYAEGREIVFQIVDTGSNFGGAVIDDPGKRAKGYRPESRGDAGYLYVDIAVRDDRLLNDPRLNLENFDMFVGNGCSRASIDTVHGVQGLTQLATDIATKAQYYAGTSEGRTQYKNSCPSGLQTACNEFAARVMAETKADLNFVGKNAYDQYEYVKNKPACYTVVSSALTSTNELAAGDILFRPGKSSGGHGHVGFYVGGGHVASASIGSHVPQISTWNTSSVLTFAARIKGSSCP